MSRIGKTPIKLPEGVKLTLDGRKIKVTGKLGEVAYEMNYGISLEAKDGMLHF